MYSGEVDLKGVGRRVNNNSIGEVEGNWRSLLLYEVWRDIYN
jgi:hypothetical protein